MLVKFIVRLRHICLYFPFFVLNKFGGKTLLPKHLRRRVESGRVFFIRLLGSEVGRNVFISANFFTSNFTNLFLGENGTIGIYCEFYAEGKITIGNNFLIGSNVIIHTAEHGCAFGPVPFINQKSFLKNVEIGENVYIGSSCVILPGVNIADNIIVGAGSVVTKDLLVSGIYGGSPARLIRSASEIQAQ